MAEQDRQAGPHAPSIQQHESCPRVKVILPHSFTSMWPQPLGISDTRKQKTEEEIQPQTPGSAKQKSPQGHQSLLPSIHSNNSAWNIHQGPVEHTGQFPSHLPHRTYLLIYYWVWCAKIWLRIFTSIFTRDTTL